MTNPPVPIRRHFRRSWYVVGGFFLTVYLLGFIGFHEHSKESLPPPGRTWLDNAYLTGQLFTLESGAVNGAVPWKLEVARFLAPIAAAVALIQALVSSFSFLLSRLWLRWRGGHVIVGGIGEKGALLVRELLQEGRKVIVIDPDPGNPGLGECRQLGALVITGRVDDPAMLQKACVNSASELIAATGSDSVNLEAAILAKRLRCSQSTPKGRLRCIVHVGDPALQEALKRRDPFSGFPEVSLEVVNVLQTGARVMLERARLDSRLPAPGQRLCLAMLGLGTFGHALLTRLLRDWAILRAERAATGSPELGTLSITLVDLKASEKEVVLRRRFGPLLEGVELKCIDGDATERGLIPTAGIDAAFVCFNNDALATLASLRLGDQDDGRCGVFIRMVENAGFSTLLRETASTHSTCGCGPGFDCCPIGLGDIQEFSELFLHGDREVLARAFHSAYLAGRSGSEAGVSNDPALVPWEDLPPFLQNSNRAAADGVPARLAAAGLKAVPSPDRPITLLELTPGEVSALAEHEHRRWCEERTRLGFRHGPKKDPEAKTHPLLRDWSTLTPEDQAYNRADSLRLPFVLARADLEVVRIS